MKSKSPELDTYPNKYFTSILLILFFSFTLITSTEDFEGTFTITIPGNRLLKSMKLGVESSPSQPSLIIQNQLSTDADSMVQVGNIAKVTLTRHGKSKLRYKASEDNALQAIFYLYDNAERLERFIIRPKFYSKNNEFHSKGMTDKIFNLEFIDVDRVGQNKGILLKKIESVAFDIGSENSFQLDLKPAKGKKIAVKLFAQDVGQHFLHFPTKKNGEYPFDLIDQKGRLVRRAYSAPISFNYVLRSSPNHKPLMDSKFNQLTDEVNHYVRSHVNYGKNTLIEVPIRLEMNLKDVTKTPKMKTLVGPFNR